MTDHEKAIREALPVVAWAATSDEGEVEALGFNQSRRRFDTPLVFLSDAQAVASELQASRERVRVLEADARRLDWLIAERNCVVDEGKSGFWLCWIDEYDSSKSSYQLGSFPTARAAIDAAIEASQGGGG